MTLVDTFKIVTNTNTVKAYTNGPLVVCFNRDNRARWFTKYPETNIKPFGEHAHLIETLRPHN